MQVPLLYIFWAIFHCGIFQNKALHSIFFFLLKCMQDLAGVAMEVSTAPGIGSNGCQQCLCTVALLCGWQKVITHALVITCAVDDNSQAPWVAWFENMYQLSCRANPWNFLSLILWSRSRHSLKKKNPQSSERGKEAWSFTCGLVAFIALITWGGRGAYIWLIYHLDDCGRLNLANRGIIMKPSCTVALSSTSISPVYALGVATPLP